MHDVLNDFSITKFPKLDTVFQFFDKIADIFFGKGIPPPNDGALVFND